MKHTSQPFHTFLLVPAAALLFLALNDLASHSSFGAKPDDSRFSVAGRQARELHDPPLADKTPVEFTYLGVKYRVPRNYLADVPGPLSAPIFRVTFPGFEPLNENTSRCLSQDRADWPTGCVPIDFWLAGASRSPNGKILSDEDHFNNAIAGLPPQNPKPGPGGIELYQYGEGDKRIDYYRKKTPTHTLFISCTYFASSTKPDAFCTNYFSPLPNGNSLSYKLTLDQLADAERIDRVLRMLIDSFEVEENVRNK